MATRERNAGLLGRDVRARAGTALGAVQAQMMSARTPTPCTSVTRAAPSLSWIGTW